VNDDQRADGFMNIITGVGTRRDPTTSTDYTPETALSQGVLEAIYEGDGIGRRIVEMPAEEMCREWFSVETDSGTGEDMADHLETLGARQVFIEASVWARLYGGAGVYFLLDDGLDADQPVIPERIRSVQAMHVYDRFAISFDRAGELSQNPLRRLRGLPEFYHITPAFGGQQFRVHESRMVLVPGRRLSDRRRQANGGWDAPVLQGVYTNLQRYSVAMGYSANILRDFVQVVLAVKGLTDLISSGREAVVTRRVQMLDVSRSILNAVIIDADGEEYTKNSSSVAGLPDLLDRFAEHLSASCGIPISKLFGRSPAGLNATGENEVRNYYDMLASEQERTLSPLAEEAVRLLFLAKDGPTGGVEPNNWSVRWESLFQPTEKEVVEVRKMVAETDKIYVDSGVLAADEVAQSRFGTGAYSIETTLTEGTDRDTVASLDPETEAEMAIGIAQATKPAPGQPPQ
jgi:phage-related protein (TIGR01555 family)